MEFQDRAIKMIKALTDSLQSLEHRRNMGDLSLFYHCFNEDCFDDDQHLRPSTVTLGRVTRFP